MTIRRSVAARDAANDSFETVVGTGPIMRHRTGVPPVNAAAGSTGTVIATANLPADWMSASAGGTKSKIGTWSDPSADATGLIGHYEIFDSTDTVCHERGICAETWQGSKVYALNQHASQGGNVYRCTTSGTSAISGGPTGVGGSISDGSVVWAYVEAGPDMLLGNTNINAGQPVEVLTYAITQGNA